MCLARSFAVREERAAWLVMGIGLLGWAAGEVTWTLVLTDDPDPPYPSAGDVLQLAFYPASYTSLLLLARSRTDPSAAASGSTAPSRRSRWQR